MRPRRPRIVVLGMLTSMPVAGVVWQNLHYLLGLERLGYEAYYVEAHARTPAMLMERESDDGAARAAAFLAPLMRRFGLGNRWAFHALHDDGRCLGMTRRELDRLYGSADLLLNLHGGTMPRPEHTATGRLVYVETDPVLLQLELHWGLRATIDFLDQHVAYFTFGERYGHPDCALPVSDRYAFHPTRQPVVADLWAGRGPEAPEAFTTIGNWRQPWRDVTFDGETYTWSKHHEFLKILDLPSMTAQPLELALSSYDEGDRRDLEARGWRVRHALEVSRDADDYRRYVAGSRGELTVAKDQNVRLASGWFSDRSATYLAAGRPVVTQETGFSRVLPTGEGLFAFTTADEARDALERINADYARHRRAAARVAREHFGHDVVLGAMLDRLGMAPPSRRRSAWPPPLPADLRLEPVSRRPTTLHAATEAAVLRRPLPAAAGRGPDARPRASVVVVTHDNLAYTRMCLESCLLAEHGGRDELIVVDNASDDGTPEYLRSLEAAGLPVRVVLNRRNAGFPAACNQGLERARGDLLVLLNNDTVVPRGWLGRLAAHLADPRIGLLGPLTNRIGTTAEIPAGYATLGEFERVAWERATGHAGETTDADMLAMFCLAMRRDVHALLGPLDERFGIGTLEDDDYCMRARRAGLRLAHAEDVMVHHFGEASFGRLAASGGLAGLTAANRRRFEEKWGEPWRPYARRPDPGYEDLRRRLRATVEAVCPPGATVMVVSRGDEELVRLAGRRGWHFPQDEDGVYAGHHPADGAEALRELARLRGRGGRYLVVPATAAWWLDHYGELREHLEGRRRVAATEHCVVFDLDAEGRSVAVA
jgi:GT2 family glycosyltransferase